ncbi:MAG: hypothetical protein ACTS4V_00210 [Candidatus Hodgkinia cicadicola]
MGDCNCGLLNFKRKLSNLLLKLKKVYAEGDWTINRKNKLLM